MVDRALVALGPERSLAWARLKLLEQLVAPETFGPIRVLAWVPFDPEALRIVRDQGTEIDYAHTVNGTFPRFGDEGPANWAMPRWVDRIVPNLSIEATDDSAEIPEADKAPTAAADGNELAGLPQPEILRR